jgi:hypothetical protein
MRDLEHFPDFRPNSSLGSSCHYISWVAVTGVLWQNENGFKKWISDRSRCHFFINGQRVLMKSETKPDKDVNALHLSDRSGRIVQPGIFTRDYCGARCRWTLQLVRNMATCRSARMRSLWQLSSFSINFTSSSWQFSSLQSEKLWRSRFPQSIRQASKHSHPHSLHGSHRVSHSRACLKEISRVIIDW